jgi:hypothetical protein
MAGCRQELGKVVEHLREKGGKPSEPGRTSEITRRGVFTLSLYGKITVLFYDLSVNAWMNKNCFCAVAMIQSIGKRLEKLSRDNAVAVKKKLMNVMILVRDAANELKKELERLDMVRPTNFSQLTSFS